MIHGNGYIVFKIGTTEYELEESIITEFDTIEKQLVIESELDNLVYYDAKEERLRISGVYNIYKNESFITQFKTIYAQRNKNVKFRFSAGNYFLDDEGLEADFYLTMKLVQYPTDSRHDYLLFTFTSLRPIDLIQSTLSENQIFDEKGSDLFPKLDEDGNLILSE